MDRQEEFYRLFQDKIRALKEQIAELGNTPPDKRREAHDGILAGLAALTTELSDAAEYVPSYDQRKHAQAIAGAQDELKKAMAKVAPRSRFQFKSRGAATTPVVNDPRLAITKSIPSPAPPPPASPPPPPGDDAETHYQAQATPPPTKDYNAIIASSSSLIRRPSFSSASTVSLSAHTGLHISLPPTALAAGSITGLRRCVLDMARAALPTLALRDLDRCVVVAASPGVDGPVHITGAARCTLVLAARQVRIHDCEDVDVYLRCGSRPIIEACRGMRFAPVPACYQGADYVPAQNLWDQVDDFKWLKAEHSPNWSVVPEPERVPDEVWQEALGGGERPVDETLAMFGPKFI